MGPALGPNRTNETDIPGSFLRAPERRIRVPRLAGVPIPDAKGGERWAPHLLHGIRRVDEWLPCLRIQKDVSPSLERQLPLASECFQCRTLQIYVARLVALGRFVVASHARLVDADLLPGEVYACPRECNLL